MSLSPISLDFRADIAQQIVNEIKSLESCSVVGVGSSGKGNLAHHLTRDDVRAKYFGPDAPRIVLVYINCGPYAQRALPELYLYILDQLKHAIEDLNGVFTPIHTQVNDLWEKAQKNLPLAQHNLGEAITATVRVGAEHIVLMLDDCDNLVANAPSVLFADFREMRDSHKTHLVYVTLTRRELAVLPTRETPEFEDFFELFSPAGHTIYLPPYNEKDGFEMLQRLAAKQVPPRQLSTSDLQRLYELAGGHAGLLRSIFYAYHLRNVDLFAMDAAEHAAADPDVEEECGKIWNSLDKDEQADLRVLARHGAPTPNGLKSLEWRGLVKLHVSPRPPEFFSPVFERFLAQLPGQTPPPGVKIEFTGIANQTLINGTLNTGLNPTEYEILKILVEQRPKTCSRGDLIQAMRVGESRSTKGQGDPPHRLDESIAQLKAKLGSVGQLIQRDGDGYCLGGG